MNHQYPTPLPIGSREWHSGIAVGYYSD